MLGNLDFESLVSLHYAPLYRFALSLARKESDACDLTQQTFYIWATKGQQLQDASRVKSWLFTTLHRQFLKMQRRQARFPHYELNEVSSQLPNIDPALVEQLDSAAALDWLAQVDPTFQAALALFYLEDYTQREIAEILDIPLGTVKSRLARGMAQLQMILTRRAQPQADARKERRD